MRYLLAILFLLPKKAQDWVFQKILAVVFGTIVVIAMIFYAPLLLIKSLATGNMEMAWGAFLWCIIATLPACYIAFDLMKLRKQFKEDQEFVNTETACLEVEHRAIKSIKARIEAGETKEEVQRNFPREWAVYMDCKDRLEKAEAKLMAKKAEKESQRLADEKAVRIVASYQANGFSTAELQAEHPEDWAAYLAAKARGAIPIYCAPPINGSYGWGTMILAVVLTVVAMVVIGIAMMAQP